MSRDHSRWYLGTILLCFAAQPAFGITLQVDYTYDSSNFFGAGNPQGAVAGAQAKAGLESAASYFSHILTDNFSAIQTPAPYHSSVPGSTGTFAWTWQESFTNPTTGGAVSLSDPVVTADRYIIYAGATNYTGSVAGTGAAGGFGWSTSVAGTNSFTQADINQINATTLSFQSAVETRGQASGFARWGGEVGFDTSARTWHFDSSTVPGSGETDFYSVAIHELAHSLGFGEVGGSTPWSSLVSGSNFVGANSSAQHGGSPVPLSADGAHWATSTTSTIYGSIIQQQASMTPDLLDGSRKLLTSLDAAGLADIGWQIGPPPSIPEPGSALLVAIGGIAGLFSRRLSVRYRNMCLK